MRIAQLNIGSLLEPDWPARRHEVVAWLERLDPDVACFQEAWEDAQHPNTVAWLVEQFAPGRWHWCFGGFPLPPAMWPDQSMRFGSAILSRWPIEDHELVALPVDASGRLGPVGAIQLELLHARTAGVDVFSTHLAPPPAQAYHRVEQVLFIDDAIRARHDRTTTPMPPILCGDFNAEPMSDEMRFLTSLAVIDGRSTYYQDAWQVAGDGTPGRTQDPARNRIYASMHLPPKRIDYVLVGDPFGRRGAGVVESAALAFDEPMTGVVASDHFGLVVDIAWPSRPTTPA